MPNGSAGAGKRADYSGLADRQTGVGRGRHPLDGPALSHPGSRRRSSCATPALVRGNAHMPYHGL